MDKTMNKVKLIVATLVTLGIITACSDDSGVVDQGKLDNYSSYVDLNLSGYQFDTDTLDIPRTGDKQDDDIIEIPISCSVRAVTEAGVEIHEARITIQQESFGPVALDTVLTNPVDGVFTDVIILRIRRNDVGNYEVLVNGKDSRDLDVNTAISKISVFYGKFPPVISDVVAPDSIKRPATGDVTFLISAKVTDQSGQKDIKVVFFTTTRPDGTPAQSKPVMFDDGTNGDLVAGDSNYTTGAKLNASNDLGTYLFEIQAVDRSNLIAPPIVHKVVVY
jgi:hypothetical protein